MHVWYTACKSIHPPAIALWPYTRSSPPRHVVHSTTSHAHRRRRQHRSRRCLSLFVRMQTPRPATRDNAHAPLCTLRVLTRAARRFALSKRRRTSAVVASIRQHPCLVCRRLYIPIYIYVYVRIYMYIFVCDRISILLPKMVRDCRKMHTRFFWGIKTYRSSNSIEQQHNNSRIYTKYFLSVWQSASTNAQHTRNRNHHTNPAAATTSSTSSPALKPKTKAQTPSRRNRRR